jgi:hypothetical protein
MNSCTDSQIRTAYEVNKMTPSEISDDLGFDEVAIKAKLMQCSSQYRRDCGAEPESEDGLNFTDEQLGRVNDVIFDLAVGGEDEHLRLKAAMYVRDDKKGRKEIVRNIQGNTFNMLTFNEAIQAARIGASKMKQQLTNGHSTEIIDLQPS